MLAEIECAIAFKSKGKSVLVGIKKMSKLLQKTKHRPTIAKNEERKNADEIRVAVPRSSRQMSGIFTLVEASFTGILNTFKEGN
jgi:hypothetical protein